MAYEFSNSELSYKLKDGRQESVPVSILRVWRKEGTEWKVAAWFSRRLEKPTTTAKK